MTDTKRTIVQCPACGENEIHGPTHDFYGYACKGCGWWCRLCADIPANADDTGEPDVVRQQLAYLIETKGTDE